MYKRNCFLRNIYISLLRSCLRVYPLFVSNKYKKSLEVLEISYIDNIENSKATKNN